MRGKSTIGRFSLPFELRAISEGLEEDIQQPLGQWLEWWRYADEDTRIDPVYDVGDYAGGRVWRPPVRLMVMRHSVEQGPLYPNDRGMYTQDDMVFVVNESEFARKLPNVAYGPDNFLLDRITWRGKVFHPTLINPRSHIHNTAVTVVIRATQVNPEELVNDPQFNWKNTRTKHGYHGTDVTHTVNEPPLREDTIWLPETDVWEQPWEDPWVRAPGWAPIDDIYG